MGYKPTLGGLKKAQEFLKKNGYPMQIFQTNIYDEKHEEAVYGELTREIPDNGQTISIDEAIRKHGAIQRMMDVQLTNEKGNLFIRFSHHHHLMILDDRMAQYGFLKAVLEYPTDNSSFNEFIESNNNWKIVNNLARWGKEEPSISDKIKFRLFPQSYAAKIFN